jgi:hypothetical protein
MPTYTYTKDDFILKRKYNISNETFTLKKIKCENKSYLFIDTDLPSILYIKKECPNICNFNIKECIDMIDLTLPNQENLYAFIFKDSIHIGLLSNTQSQNIITKHIGHQIYNLHKINHQNNLIAYTQEETNGFSFVVIDKHLNEVTRYPFEKENEVCMTFVELSEFSDNYDSSKKVFAMGTGIMESKACEPEYGYIYLLEMDKNLKFTKLCEIETKGGVYKLATSNNLLYVAISSTLYVYSIKSSKQFELKLLRKSNDFTLINDLYCYDNFVVVSDVYRSITIFKFDIEKEKLIETCRDFNPIWCYSLNKVDNNIFTISDIDGNIFSLRKETQPRCDEEKFKLERVSQFNFGERINKMVTVTRSIPTRDWDNIFTTGTEGKCNKDDSVSNIKLTYFASLDGSFGLLANIPKETYEFLLHIQNEILKHIASTGNFDYEKWRAYKVTTYFNI